MSRSRARSSSCCSTRTSLPIWTTTQPTTRLSGTARSLPGRRRRPMRPSAIFGTKRRATSSSGLRPMEAEACRSWKMRVPQCPSPRAANAVLEEEEGRLVGAASRDRSPVGKERMRRRLRMGRRGDLTLRLACFPQFSALSLHAVIWTIAYLFVAFVCIRIVDVQVASNCLFYET